MQHSHGQLQIRIQCDQVELMCQGGLSKHGIGSQLKALQTLGMLLVCMVITLVGQKFRRRAWRWHFKIMGVKCWGKGVGFQPLILHLVLVTIMVS